tara:strand:+ start:143 stop:610 length:468 start_codon:yes stop_codon:yes gene_type:complete
MTEYKCPVCGTVVGHAIEGSRATFYHCGKQFPEREKFDWRAYIADTTVPMKDREAAMSRYVRHQGDKLAHLDKVVRIDLIAARKARKELIAQRDALASFEVKGTANVQFSNKPKRNLLMNHFLCVQHATQHGHEPPEQTFDACKKYSDTHKLGFF